MENGLNPNAPQGEKVAFGGESAGTTLVADSAVRMPENADHFAVAEDVEMAMGKAVRPAVGRMLAHIRRGTFLLAGCQQRLRRAEQQVLVRQVVVYEPFRCRLCNGGSPIGVRIGAHTFRDTAEKQRPQHGEYANQMSHRLFCLTRQKYIFFVIYK